MNELGVIELLQLMSEYEDRDLVVLTWYFSISLGLYSVAHFVGSKLKLFALIYIISAYGGFLAYIAIKSTNILSLKMAVIQNLITLKENEVNFGALADQQLTIAIESASPTFWSLYSQIALLSIGIVNVGFLIYKYEIGRRHRKSKSVESDT